MWLVKKYCMCTCDFSSIITYVDTRQPCHYEYSGHCLCTRTAASVDSWWAHLRGSCNARLLGLLCVDTIRTYRMRRWEELRISCTYNTFITFGLNCRECVCILSTDTATSIQRKVRKCPVLEKVHVNVKTSPPRKTLWIISLQAIMLPPQTIQATLLTPPPT